MDMYSLLTGAAGRARAAIDPIVHASTTDVQAIRGVINGTRNDVIKALGQPRASAFLAEMHAANMNLRNPATASRAVTDVLSGLNELEQAAMRTAKHRVVGGAAIIGGGIVGASLLLQGRGHTGDPIAPGPIGERPGGGGSGTSW